MSDEYFVGKSILMYAYDRFAGRKHEKTKALFEEL